MKIRNGFVSNSSSSSFIVTVEIEKEKLYKMIQDTSSFPPIKNFLEYLSNEIEKAKSTAYSVELYNYWRTTLEELYNNVLNVAELNDMQKYTELVLSHKYINISEQPPVFILTGSISMFNSYGDVPDILKEVVLNLLAEKYDVKCDQISS